jgi:hypothetical protein
MTSNSERVHKVTSHSYDTETLTHYPDLANVKKKKKLLNLYNIRRWHSICLETLQHPLTILDILQ